MKVEVITDMEGTAFVELLGLIERLKLDLDSLIEENHQEAAAAYLNLIERLTLVHKQSRSAFN